MAASPQLTGLQLAADPGAWSAAGFAVTGSGVTLGAVRIALDGEGRGGIRGWSFDLALPSEALDGLSFEQKQQVTSRSAIALYGIG